MNLAFWRGKKVFLTGHTGFKGGWLSLWLQSLGAEVTGYSLNPPTTPNLFLEANVADGMTSLIGDIRNYDSLHKAISGAQPEIIFHMAAQPLVRASYQNPVETYETNVMGTVNLLESVRHLGGIRAVVNITTDKCYENREWLWGYRENEAMGGYDPYSNSKGCAELVSSAYRSSFFNSSDYEKHGVALATARAGNVIGGGDWAVDRLIPDIFRSFSLNELVRIRNPNAVRPWQHVLEPLRGYLLLAEQLYSCGSQYAEGWNFGPNQSDAATVSVVVSKMAKLWGAGADWTADEGSHPHEANYLRLDISKARDRLNWQPILNLDNSLELSVSWAKKWMTNANTKEITLDQILTYQKLIE